MYVFAAGESPMATHSVSKWESLSDDHRVQTNNIGILFYNSVKLSGFFKILIKKKEKLSWVGSWHKDKIYQNKIAFAHTCLLKSYLIEKTY